MSLFDPIALAKITQGEWMDGKLPKAIQGFSFDSRIIKPDEFFIALRSSKADGHYYLNAALAAGASGAMVERFNATIPFPQLKVGDSLKAFQLLAKKQREFFKGIVIGVTGSCGKTTTKDLLTHLLGLEKTQATYLNFNNLIGVPLTLLGLDNSKHQYGVIEAGMNQIGEMACLAAMIQPDISIITNVYPVHLEGLGSVERIAQEKAYLAQSTGNMIFLPECCLQYEIFKSLKNKCSIPLYEIKYHSNKTVSLYLSNNEYILPIYSHGMLSNIALAIAVCQFLGIESYQIKECLKIWKPSQYRGQIVKSDKLTYYVDCYNANPVAMKDSLEVFQRHFDSIDRRLYILGSMTELLNEASRYHCEVGESLKLKKSDKILLLGDNAEDYERGLKLAGNEDSQIICLKKREDALDYLKDFEGAVFLKGSKPYALWELVPGFF